MEHPRADLLTAQSGDRCPACSAALRPGAPWCTLCYADLRPAVREPDPPGRHATPGDGGGARAAHLDPRWPCTGCGYENPMGESACATCGTGFLSGLRDQEPPLLELPGVGDLSLLSRAQGIGLAASVVLVVVLLTMLLSILAG